MRLWPRDAAADRGAAAEGRAREAAAVEADITNRLAELVEDVRSVNVDADDRRELLTLIVRDAARTPCEARALSDGTLRFLALALIERDPEARGVICLEEPENGIHPERIGAMLRLLRDIAVDPDEAVGPDNPLRQVIVNTHSPLVVAQLPDDCVLMARGEPRVRNEAILTTTQFRWFADTWRAKADPGAPCASRGELLRYLDPLPRRAADVPPEGVQCAPRAVIDRPDIQRDLFSDATDEPDA
jgi:predicted ATPase